MKRCILTLLIVVAASSCFGRFSEFIRLTPESESSHRLRVSFAPINSGHTRITYRWNNQNKECWLLIFQNDQSIPDQLDFRDIIWNRQSTLPPGVAQLIPLSADNDGFVEITLQDSLIPRAFICIDFPDRIMDGGYYYTIDLSAYVKKPERSVTAAESDAD